jgi:hypothetical protein
MTTFRNPLVMPTDGKTVDTACWVRRIAVFSNIRTKSKTEC